jgi:Concanavalin A-like lectin/glucanases superfamily/Domain of unknown function (DUF2341)
MIMRPFIIVLVSSMLLFFHCTPVMDAGSSVSGNGRVTGCLLLQNGNPAPHAQVMILLETYDPVRDTLILNSIIDTTDAGGTYAFSHVDSGTYNILAVGFDERTRALTMGIRVNGDSVTVPAVTLRSPGTIKVVLPSGIDATNGYCFIPGTMNYSFLSDNDSTFILDSVPAGVSLSIFYAVRGSSGQTPKVIRDSVIVTPGGVMNIENIGWNFSKKLFLNTTATGANVAGIATDFPILVRLNGTNFKFADAKPDGADLRFTKSDGTSLPYEIERWDASQSSAEIWVKADTVFGNDSTHFMTMYWGNSNAAGASNSAAVFDTAAGFQAVWHLGETTAGVESDATANHFGATSSSPTPAAVMGEVGLCQQFDGTSNCFHAFGTASGKLNFPAQSSYTLSAWVYADTLDTMYQKIIEKNNYQYKLQIDWEKNWSFGEYESSIGHELTNWPATAKTWIYLVGVRSGGLQYLYVNGVCVNSAISTVAFSYARDTTTDIFIGRSANSVLYGPYFFKGKIDEARIENRTPNADWIRLCYMNQNTPDRLVVFR